MRFELVNDVGDVDGGVVVVRDAVGRTGGGGNVIGLAGVCDPGVVGGKPICRGSEVDERRIGVADETGITGVLHHDQENVLVVFEGRAIAELCLKSLGSRRSDKNRNQQNA